MRSYYDYSNVCFAGENEILMNNNYVKKVKDLKKNDIIKGFDGQEHKILCVIKTKIQDKAN